jgi:hypothetical protein
MASPAAAGNFDSTRLSEKSFWPAHQPTRPLQQPAAEKSGLTDGALVFCLCCVAMYMVEKERDINTKKR